MQTGDLWSVPVPTNRTRVVWCSEAVWTDENCEWFRHRTPHERIPHLSTLLAPIGYEARVEEVSPQADGSSSYIITYLDFGQVFEVKDYQIREKEQGASTSSPQPQKHKISPPPPPPRNPSPSHSRTPTPSHPPPPPRTTQKSTNVAGGDGGGSPPSSVCVSVSIPTTEAEAGMAEEHMMPDSPPPSTSPPVPPRDQTNSDTDAQPHDDDDDDEEEEADEEVESSEDDLYDESSSDGEVLPDGSWDEKKTRKCGEKRLMVAEEILTTEETFVDNLTKVSLHFYQPLLASIKNKELHSQGQEILSQKDVDVLFGEIPQLLILNTKFLDDLKKRLLNWEGKPLAEQVLGDFFLQYAPFFKMYAQYGANHEVASELLDKLLKRKRFYKFLRSAAEACGGTSLESYLIMPIQRLPRYKLLVSELLKRTPPGHDDQEPLGKAIDLIINSTMHVNNRIKTQRNRDLMCSTQARFSTNPRFLDAHRMYIREGPLKKVGTKGLKKFEFFLFNDMLAYASYGFGGKLKLRRTLPIDEAFRVEDVPDAAEYTHQILIVNSEKSFKVCAEGVPQKQSWLNDLQDCITKQRKVRANRGITRMDSKKAAVVVKPKDRTVAVCVLCQKPFGLMRHKHSCKECHRLTCSSCLHKGRCKICEKSKRKVKRSGSASDVTSDSEDIMEVKGSDLAAMAKQGKLNSRGPRSVRIAKKKTSSGGGGGCSGGSSSMGFRDFLAADSPATATGSSITPSPSSSRRSSCDRYTVPRSRSRCVSDDEGSHTDSASPSPLPPSSPAEPQSRTLPSTTTTTGNHLTLPSVDRHSTRRHSANRGIALPGFGGSDPNLLAADVASRLRKSHPLPPNEASTIEVKTTIDKTNSDSQPLKPKGGIAYLSSLHGNTPPPPPRRAAAPLAVETTEDDALWDTTRAASSALSANDLKHSLDRYHQQSLPPSPNPSPSRRMESGSDIESDVPTTQPLDTVHTHREEATETTTRDDEEATESEDEPEDTTAARVAVASRGRGRGRGRGLGGSGLGVSSGRLLGYVPKSARSDEPSAS